MCQGVLFLISVMSRAMAEIILALRRMIPTANSDSVLMSKREKKYLSSCHVAAKKKKNGGVFVHRGARRTSQFSLILASEVLAVPAGMC